MKKIYLILLAITISAGVLYATTYSGSGYTIDYSNWYKSSHPTVEVLFLAPKNSTATYHENVSVITKANPGGNNFGGWDHFKKHQVKALKGIVGSLKVIRYETIKLDNMNILARDAAQFLQDTFSLAKIKINIIEAKGEFTDKLELETRKKGFAVSRGKQQVEGYTNLQYVLDTIEENIILVLTIPEKCRLSTVYEKNTFKKIGQSFSDNFNNSNSVCDDKSFTPGFFTQSSR